MTVTVKEKVTVIFPVKRGRNNKGCEIPQIKIVQCPPSVMPFLHSNIFILKLPKIFYMDVILLLTDPV